MNLRTLAILAAVAACGVAAWVLVSWEGDGAPPPAETAVASESPASAPPVQGGPVAPAASRQQVAAVEGGGGSESATPSVASALEHHRGLFGDQPPMGPDKARALVERRKAEVERLQEELAAQGADAVEQVREAWGTTRTTREKLLLLGTLERIEDSAAPGLLQELLAGEEGFTVREAMVKALARGKAPGRVAALLGVLGHPEPRLQVAAVQGLYGQREALADMSRLVRAGGDMVVRLEALHTLAAIPGPEALAALESFESSDLLVPRIRQFASKELQRRRAGKMGALD